MAIKVGNAAAFLAGVLAATAMPVSLAGDLSTITAAAEVPTTPFLGGFIKETRVIYPLRIGDWEAQDEHLYDDQYLGASVRYAHVSEKDRWIDLYFYPAGVLPESRLMQDVDSTLEGIRSSTGKQGSYSEVDIAPVDALSFVVGSGKSKQEVAAGSTSLRLVREGKAYSSSMVMVIKDLYYIKGRYSAEESALSQRDVKKQLEKLMREVVRSATVRSSGDCWMAPPIIARPAPLATDSPGRLATISHDGTIHAVAYQDRVEALDVASPQAILLQATVMGMTQRLLPGCVAPENMNPSVPEGMRELRLEFRAAPVERSSPSVPLRPSRAGVT